MDGAEETDAMIGRFEVEDARVLEDRSLFALVGVIADGTARTGMYAAVDDDRSGFDARIHGVEVLEAADDDGGPSVLALTFSYSTEEKLERWRSVDWPGQRLRLYWER